MTWWMVLVDAVIIVIALAYGFRLGRQHEREMRVRDDNR